MEQAYDTLDMPTLLLRDENSDLLPPETVQAMTQHSRAPTWW